MYETCPQTLLALLPLMQNSKCTEALQLPANEQERENPQQLDVTYEKGC
jgi:hypothetical protein